MLKYMTIADAVGAVSGSWMGETSSLQKQITEVVTDSRKIVSGTCFIALPGERVDGHDFIAQVLVAGASCAISERKLDMVDAEGKEIVDYILVEDTRKALRDLAAFYRQLLDITVVGITGSVGKTSTKEMVASVLSEKFKTQKTAGNFNNEIGLPLTVFSITEEHEVAVLEMGISDFGEMSRLAQIACPDIMVITNIGQCHLENLGDRDGVLKAKTECFDYLNTEAKIVLNGKDDKLSTVSKVHEQVPFFYGIADEISSPKLFCEAVEVVSLGLSGSDATISIDGKKQRIHIPIAGAHMVINASAAATVGYLLGMRIEEIARGIEKSSAVAGRGRLIQTDKYLLVDDTYNANPVSMRAEIDLLEQSKGRRVAILGDMFELGGDEKKMHHELGVYAIKKCDVLICIGSLSRDMFEGARGEITNSNSTKDAENVYYFADKDSFINVKDDILNEGDTILLKASHGMEFGKLLDKLS